MEWERREGKGKGRRKRKKEERGKEGKGEEEEGERREGEGCVMAFGGRTPLSSRSQLTSAYILYKDSF